MEDKKFKVIIVKGKVILVFLYYSIHCINAVLSELLYPALS